MADGRKDSAWITQGLVEIWMVYPDPWLTPASYLSVEGVAAAAFQSCRTSCEGLCLRRGSVWGLEPGVLDKATCTMTRESHFQCYEWPTSELQEDQVFSRWFVLYLSYSSRQLHFWKHSTPYLWWEVLSSWNWEARKGRTCLCIFSFPLEFRIVSSGTFLPFDIFKEGSCPVCCRQCIR